MIYAALAPHHDSLDSKKNILVLISEKRTATYWLFTERVTQTRLNPLADTGFLPIYLCGLYNP